MCSGHEAGRAWRSLNRSANLVPGTVRRSRISQMAVARSWPRQRVISRNFALTASCGRGASGPPFALTSPEDIVRPSDRCTVTSDQRPSGNRAE